jgi:hypothetical protein
MIELEVNCLQRARPEARHHEITHLGHRGFACRIPVELAILQIRGGLNLYYTLDPATLARVYIGLRREAGKCPYLQAHVGDRWTGHLLALPECRAGYRVIREGAALDTRQAVRFLAPR